MNLRNFDGNYSVDQKDFLDDSCGGIRREAYGEGRATGPTRGPARKRPLNTNRYDSSKVAYQHQVTADVTAREGESAAIMR